MKLMSTSQPDRSRHILRTLTVFLIAIPLSTTAARANIVYTVNTTFTTANPTGNPLQQDTILGTITTDGTIGVLATSDILSYNLNLIDHLNNANNYDLTPLDSTIVENYGGALSASPTALSFDYSDAGAEFLIQHSAYSGYNYFCFSASGGACLQGETIAPQYYSVDGVVEPGLTGVQQLNPPGTTPEPSTCTLLLTGLLVVGGAARRRLRF